MNKFIKYFLSTVVLITVVLGFGKYFAVKENANIRAGATTNFSGVTVNSDGLSFKSPTVTPPQNQFTTALTQVAYAGTFTPFSTTMFSFRNPFNATSTVTLALVSGTNGTTTIDILVGTSTSATIVKNSDVSPSLINSTLVATSTQFYIANGTLAGSGTGFTSPGTGSQARVVVGPNEFVTGLATSSYIGFSTIGNSGITGALSTFTGQYKIEFSR